MGNKKINNASEISGRDVLILRLYVVRMEPIKKILKNSGIWA